MRFLFVLLIALAAVSVQGQTIVVRGPAVISAQEHATIIARRGTLVHSQCSQTEGIGMGSTPEQARRNCCFFGRKVIVEEGIAYSPARRMYFAVIRYR
jgi:hypothetical protein